MRGQVGVCGPAAAIFERGQTEPLVVAGEPAHVAERLSTPGLHAFWLLARDQVGTFAVAGRCWINSDAVAIVGEVQS